jgi:hypothetical protein
VFTENWWFPRFDYGAKCYRDYWDSYTGIPNTYPMYNANNYCNFKLSMYFTYTSAQNYVRTLTQGVTLTDSLKRTGNFKRSAAQTVKGTAAMNRFASFPRKCLMSVKSTMAFTIRLTLIRKAIEQVRAAMGFLGKRGLSRRLEENVNASMAAKCFQGFCRKAQENVKGIDGCAFKVLFVRSLPETVKGSEGIKRWGTCIRRLFAVAANTAGTSHTGAYYRTETETVQAEGAVFRGLGVFIKIITASFVRDFFIRRFLKSNEDLVLKSCICRELILDSPIH